MPRRIGRYSMVGVIATSGQIELEEPRETQFRDLNDESIQRAMSESARRDASLAFARAKRAAIRRARGQAGAS